MTTKHKEAFALMWYSCHCGHQERIWNNRDGVTPFCTSCPSCGQASLRHTMWGLDKPAPDHQPHPGQRVWRDGTQEEAVAMMERRIASMRAAGHPLDDDEAAEILAAVRSGDQLSEFAPGWPTLVIVEKKGVVP